MSLAANTLMLVAIPIEGSHYLVDVIAGIAVALAAWAAASRAVTFASTERRAQATLNPAKAIAP